MIRGRARTVALLLAVLIAGTMAYPALSAADIAPDPGTVVTRTRDATPPEPPALAATPPAPPSYDPYSRPDPPLGEALWGIALVTVGVLLAAFAPPLVLTVAIEVPVIVLFGRGAPRRTAGAAVLVNTLTNPLLVGAVLLFTPVWGSSWGAAAVLAFEAVVVVVEWRLYRWALGWSSRRALAASLVANAVSFGIGVALGYDGGVLIGLARLLGRGLGGGLLWGV